MIISCFIQPYLIDECASSNKCYNIRFLCFCATSWSYRANFFYGKQRGTLLVLKIKYLAQNFSNFTFYLLVI